MWFDLGGDASLVVGVVTVRVVTVLSRSITDFFHSTTVITAITIQLALQSTENYWASFSLVTI